jgi:flagellar hook-length control protein FliK
MQSVTSLTESLFMVAGAQGTLKTDDVNFARQAFAEVFAALEIAPASEQQSEGRDGKEDPTQDLSPSVELVAEPDKINVPAQSDAPLIHTDKDKSIVAVTGKKGRDLDRTDPPAVIGHDPSAQITAEKKIRQTPETEPRVPDVRAPKEKTPQTSAQVTRQPDQADAQQSPENRGADDPSTPGSTVKTSLGLGDWHASDEPSGKPVERGAGDRDISQPKGLTTPSAEPGHQIRALGLTTIAKGLTGQPATPEASGIAKHTQSAPAPALQTQEQSGAVPHQSESRPNHHPPKGDPYLQTPLAEPAKVVTADNRAFEGIAPVRAYEKDTTLPGDIARAPTGEVPAAAPKSGLAFSVAGPEPAWAKSRSPGDKTAVESLRFDVPLSESMTPAPTQKTAPLHGADLPRHIAQQLHNIARHMPERPVEISLNPEELGRVRMSVTTVGDTISIAVAVDRTDTLDLMRRHIDQMAQEFRALGFGDVAFSLDQNTRQRAFGDDADNENPEKPAPVDGPADPVIALSLGARDGLDLRL